MEQQNAQAEPVEAKVSGTESKAEVASEEKVEQVSDQTFTQAELDTKLTELKTKWETESQIKADEAEKDWQSRKDKEFQPLKGRIEELEKTSQESIFKAREDREREALGDTPEVRQIHQERRSDWADRQRLSQERAEFESVQAQVAEKGKALLLKDLVTEFGVDGKKLAKAETEGEMRSIALELYAERLKEENEELKKDPQKIDSSLPSAGGGGYKAIRDAYSADPTNPVKWAAYLKARREKSV